MANFLTNFFGPLDKSACVYFLIISVMFFIVLLLVLGTELIFVFKNFNRLNFRIFSNGLLILFNIFVAYFVNRLLYTMCYKSLA
jgi:hypothetical protein